MKNSEKHSKSRRNSQILKRVALFPKDPLNFYNCLKKKMQENFEILKTPKSLKGFKEL